MVGLYPHEDTDVLAFENPSSVKVGVIRCLGLRDENQTHPEPTKVTRKGARPLRHQESP